MCDPAGLVHIACPLQPTDSLNISSWVDIPWYLPNGDFEMTMSAVDLAGKEIFCATVKFALTSLGAIQRSPEVIAGEVLDASEGIYLRGDN